MNTFDKIDFLLKEQNLKQIDLTNYLGVPKTHYTDWKKGRTSSYNKYLVQIADYFSVSVDYLLGKEDNNKKTPDAKSNVIFLDNQNIHMIPVFESVAAGLGAYADNTVIDYLPIHFFNHSEAENTVCVKVSGDSMYPKIENGDIIQIYKTDIIDSGTIAVVMLDGDEALVKKVVYGKDWIELHSINPMYPVMRFEREETMRIKVFGQVKKIIKNV